jgi:hypothetical protein
MQKLYKNIAEATRLTQRRDIQHNDAQNNDVQYNA